MLAFFAVRGITPSQILNGGVLERRFYWHAMNMYYQERKDIIELFVRLLGGDMSE